MIHSVAFAQDNGKIGKEKKKTTQALMKEGDDREAMVKMRDKSDTAYCHA